MGINWNSGASGTIDTITSTSHTVIVTDPTGPTTNIEVAGGPYVPTSKVGVASGVATTSSSGAVLSASPYASQTFLGNIGTVTGTVYQTIIGSGSTGGTYAVAMGYNCSGGAGGGVAVGNNCTATGTDCVALGIRVTALGNYSIAIGATSSTVMSASAAGSFVIGTDHTGVGPNSATQDLGVIGTVNHTVNVPGTLWTVLSRITLTSQSAGSWQSVNGATHVYTGPAGATMTLPTPSAVGSVIRVINTTVNAVTIAVASGSTVTAPTTILALQTMVFYAIGATSWFAGEMGTA